MKYPHPRWSLALLGALSAFTGPALAQDRVAGEDPAFLPRFEGANIRQYRQASLDKIVIPTGPVADADRPASAEFLEGEIGHIDYLVTPAVAPLEIERHYRTLLQQAGYDIAFACAGERQCGRDMASLILNSGRVAPSGLADGIFSDGIRILVARKGSDRVLMHVNSGPDAAHAYVATIAGGVPAP